MFDYLRGKIIYSFKLSDFYSQKSKDQVQQSRFYLTLKIQIPGTSRRQVQCQCIKVSQRMLDFLWKCETNLSKKCQKGRVSSWLWKSWHESSVPWKPWILFDTLPRIQKNPWKMPFSDFHGAPEICLSLNKTQIIIR